VHAGKGQQHPIEKSRELQRKLYRAAKKCRNRRFHALYDRVFRPDVLWRAWQEVRANGGSAGVDGETLEDVERRGVGNFLESISADLKAGRYRPKPVLRVYVPKADGRQRPLGIPTVRDRVVQQACRIVIEPIFEANFEDQSYGFRPKRSAAQAVQKIDAALVRGWWVVEADIQGYFDAIDHGLLLNLVRRRVSDRRVLKLISQWLRAGVVEEGHWRSTDHGSPQGGVISPLLANIYLHVLDRYWRDRYLALGVLVRYADDFVIVCRGKVDAEQAMGVVRQIMTKLKLQLHPTKTKLVNLKQEGFEFLGFHFRKVISRKSGKLVPLMWPGKKAMKAVRNRIRERTDRSALGLPMAEIVAQLNPIIRGWRNYFVVGHSMRHLRTLDRYVWFRLWKSATARHGFRGCLTLSEFKTWFTQSGVEYFYATGETRA
jgi:RNA-directed DNA polymerase